MQSVIHPLEVFSIFLVCWGKSLINYNSPFQHYKMPLLNHWSLRTPVSSTCFWKMCKGNYFVRCQRLVAIFASDCLCQEIWLSLVDKRHVKCTISQLTFPPCNENNCMCWSHFLVKIPSFLHSCIAHTKLLPAWVHLYLCITAFPINSQNERGHHI